MAVKRRIPRTGLLRPKTPGPKHPGGRPPLYHDGVPDVAYKLCLLGATDAEMAEVFGVVVETINEWKAAHPEFSAALSRGKILADADMARSLYQRGIGYSHQAEKIFHSDGQITRARYTEHYPPDTAAAKHWLNNRRGHQWREKIEHAGDPTQPVVFQVIRTARGK